MHLKYPRLFSPIKLGPVEVSSRFYSSPHVIPHTDQGAPTEIIRYVGEESAPKSMADIYFGADDSGA